MLSPESVQDLAWEKSAGLLPAVIQHARDGRVLMLGYMSPASLQRSLQEGVVWFYSRSRDRLWMKGETSGNVLELVSAHSDCDADALLIRALPAGPVCHRGTATCFADDPGPLLHALGARLDARIADADAESSYTARLVAEGVTAVAQKVGEEGVETALAATSESDERLVSESADLIYHLLVLLRARGVGDDALLQELDRRMRPD